MNCVIGVFKNMMKEALVILSGGADSTICLAWAKTQFKNVYAITFNYGQRHLKEIESAKKVAELLKVKQHFIIDIPDILEGTSPLINNNNEVAKYKDVEHLPGGVEPTFVPSRNMLFFTIASNKAYNLGIRDLVSGVCQADSGNYWDCRYSFINTLQKCISLGNYGKIFQFNIHTPLMLLTKKESIIMAKDLDCLDVLKYTWTCYSGKEKPCMKCHSCLLRERGFKEAGIPDPALL